MGKDAELIRSSKLKHSYKKTRELVRQAKEIIDDELEEPKRSPMRYNNQVLRIAKLILKVSEI